MSEDNVDVVRWIYAGWNHGFAGLLHEDVEWVNPPGAVEGGTRTGIASFAEAASSVTDTFEHSRLDFDRFIDAGDRVVVLGTLRGTGRGSGAEVEREQGYVWTIRDGMAVRFEWFPEQRQALEAAGLEA